MKKNYKVSREDLLKVVVALERAECWLIEMAQRHPEYEKDYLKRVDASIELEMRLKEMIQCTLSETMNF